MSAAIQTAEAAVQRVWADKRLNRRTRNLAAALATRLQLDTYGHGLVALLGNGDEATNLAALETWVGQLIGQSAPEEPPSLTELETQLRSLLGPLE